LGDLHGKQFGIGWKSLIGQDSFSECPYVTVKTDDFSAIDSFSEFPYVKN
jgi:hypothetical protein